MFGFEFFNLVFGGFFFWCWLLEGIEVIVFLKSVIVYDFVFVFGNVFSYFGSVLNFMWFNVV